MQQMKRTAEAAQLQQFSSAYLQRDVLELTHTHIN